MPGLQKCHPELRIIGSGGTGQEGSQEVGRHRGRRYLIDEGLSSIRQGGIHGGRLFRQPECPGHPRALRARNVQHRGHVAPLAHHSGHEGDLLGRIAQLAQDEAAGAIVGQVVGLQVDRRAVLLGQVPPLKVLPSNRCASRTALPGPSGAGDSARACVAFITNGGRAGYG